MQVWVQHSGFIARYLHLSSWSVRVGQAVVAGQNLGVMGKTGNVSGVHLHLEIAPGGGAQVDPVPFLRARISAAASGEWPARARYGEAHVRAVQEKANRLGATLDVDGKDGPSTQAWVRAFQGAHGLTADGVAGPLTVTAIDVALLAAGGKLDVDGNFGPASIAALQRALGVRVDSQMGPITVSALQAALGVTVDGSAGPATVRALQTMLGVAVDGRWGPDTTRALQAWLNAGKAITKPAQPSGPKIGRNATSRPTADIQRLVGVNPDGDYGADTTVKVIAWQAANGLDADGVWGPASDAKGFPSTPLPEAPKPATRTATYPASKAGYTSPLTSDRAAGDVIRRLIVHHCAATSDQLSYFLTKNERGSAPTWYVRSDGSVIETIAPAKKPSSTSSANSGSVAIETQNTSGAPAWGISEASHEAIASIAAWLSRQTSLDGVPVEFVLDRAHLIGHNEAGVNATACPGPSMDLDRIVKRAREIAAPPVTQPEPVQVDRSILQGWFDKLKQLLGGGS
ncbi:hypothetical protein D514_0111620 [Microbacterium sp. UCD-TDU]|nr:hypothetical protein D514_0111620 [Microbacterium sp. UCD-TDU]